MKKIPLRKCIVNNIMLPKEDLLRIYKTKEGIIDIDLTNKGEGRGAYIKKDIETLETLKRRKILYRLFKVNIDDSIYLKIEKAIKEGK